MSTLCKIELLHMDDEDALDDELAVWWMEHKTLDNEEETACASTVDVLAILSAAREKGE
jgi:hypothetical protein